MPDLYVNVDIALTAVPVNRYPLIDDTDFTTIEESVAYNATGMDLNWNFMETDGTYSHTNVVPTTGSNHDWTHQGNGMYTLEIPDTGGTINNVTEGVGWFTGICDGVLAWSGPTICFRAAQMNNSLINGNDKLQVDAHQISGDTDAATNAEAFFNGTGYNASNSTIGTVTTLTGHTAQTGDNYARLGAPAGASVSADIAAVKTDSAAILVDTGTTLDGKIDTIDTNVDAILVDTDTTIPALIAALNDLSAANVNAEVADVINTDTYTEVSAGAPTDTPTLSGMIRELYWAWKNKKTITSSTLTIRNSADSATLHTATVSDDSTTFEKGEFGA